MTAKPRWPLAERQEIDLLLTDVGLPDISGVTLADQLRGMLPGLKVSFATGHGRVDGVVPGKAVELLMKPYRFESLEAVVGGLLCKD